MYSCERKTGIGGTRRTARVDHSRARGPLQSRRCLQMAVWDNSRRTAHSRHLFCVRAYVVRACVCVCVCEHRGECENCVQTQKMRLTENERNNKNVVERGRARGTRRTARVAHIGSMRCVRAGEASERSKEKCLHPYTCEPRCVPMRLNTWTYLWEQRVHAQKDVLLSLSRQLQRKSVLNDKQHKDRFVAT
jgi:hypothetical protein